MAGFQNILPELRGLCQYVAVDDRTLTIVMLDVPLHGRRSTTLRIARLCSGIGKERGLDSRRLPVRFPAGPDLRNLSAVLRLEPDVIV